MEDILDDLDYKSREGKTFRRASTGQRFANYLIDSICYLLLSGLIGVLLGVLLAVSGNEEMLLGAETIQAKVMEWVLSLFIITVFYTILEYAFKGKTLGKVITKTRAVNMDYSRMTLQETFIRSLCRLIPFDAFSYLGDGYGWHDSISKTQVIEDEGWYDNE